MINHKRMLAGWTLEMLGVAAQPHARAAEEHLGTVRSPLVSATVVAPAQQEQLGLLSMRSNGGGCTASLLSNNWAVSASHCLECHRHAQPRGRLAVRGLGHRAIRHEPTTSTGSGASTSAGAP